MIANVSKPGDKKCEQYSWAYDFWHAFATVMDQTIQSIGSHFPNRS